MIVAGYIQYIYYLLKTKMKYVSTKLLTDVHVENWGNGWVFTGYKLDSQEADPFLRVTFLHCTSSRSLANYTYVTYKYVHA